MSTGWLVLTLLLTAIAVLGLHPRRSNSLRWTVRSLPHPPRWLQPVPGALSPRQRVLLSGAAAATLGWAGASLGPPWFGAVVAVVAVAVAGWASGRIETAASRRHRVGVLRDLPEGCSLLAAGLRAGLPLRAAVSHVVAVTQGPLHEELSRVLENIRAGQPEADAWRALTGLEPLRRLALDLARSTDSGERLAEVLSEHATMARTAARADRQTRARAAGVRSVLPLCVCFLPAFFLIGIAPVIAAGISAFLP